jgi:two-component system, LuxR family, sensor histidine kinase DctS
MALNSKRPLAHRRPAYWGWLLFFVAAVLGLALLSIHLAGRYQSSKSQDELEREAKAAAEKLRSYFIDLNSSLTQQAERSAILVRGLSLSNKPPEDAANLLQNAWSGTFNSMPSLMRIELRDQSLRRLAGIDTPPPNARLRSDGDDQLMVDTRVAIELTRDRKESTFSRSYYRSFGASYGGEVVDLIVPSDSSGSAFFVFTISISRAMETALPVGFLSTYGVALADLDGSMIARTTGLLFRQSESSADIAVRIGDQGVLLRASRPLGKATDVANTQLGLLLLLCTILLASGVMLWRALSQRRRMEDSLVAETTLRRAMEDSLVTGLRARDMEGRLLYMNRAFSEMTGFDESELLGLKPPMPYWAPEGEAGYQKRYAQVLSGSIGREAFETIFMRKNGQRFPVLIHEAPLLDANGTQSGWMSSVIDISELKRAEDLNRRQQEQLQTNARMAMLGEVATVLSHEINQPLSAIQSYATASQNLLGSGHPAEAEQALSRLLQQADRAAQVVKSVGDFVQRRKLNFETIRVAETIEALRPIIQLQAKRLDVQLVCRLEKNLLIRGDRTMFEQALLNLSRNAVESMEKTPHEARILEIEACLEGHSDATISEPALHQVERAIIQVLDRGHGVPESQASQLFTAFYTTKSDGIGVGLSLTRTVAEAFGGSLTYQARPHGGSIFTLKLPISSALNTEMH